MWNYFYFALFLFNIFLCSEVWCDNSTELYQEMPKDAFRTRHSRLISFSDDGNVQLDLDFNVPFITLPIRRSLSMAKTSLVTLNIGSVLVGGTILFGASVVIPLVLAFFNKKGLIPVHSPMNYFMRAGSQRSKDSDVWRYLTIIDNALLENHIDFTSCSQRMVCLTVKKASHNVSTGKGSSTDKIVDGLASNKWIQQHLSGSLFKEAIEYGLEGRNCHLIYGNCKMNPLNIYNLAKKFLERFNVG